MKLSDIEIGASEAAAAVGLSGYETPLGLYARKLGRADPPEENEAMRLGTLLEPALAAIFEDEYEVKLREMPALWHSTKPWLRARIDRYFCAEDAPSKLRQEMDLDDGERVIVEFKTTGMATFTQQETLDRWGEAGSTVIPTEHATQVQTQIVVFNDYLDLAGDGYCNRALVKALIAHRGVPTFRVLGDPVLVQPWILDTLTSFVTEHLVPEVPPNPITLEDFGIAEELVRRPQRGKVLRQASPEEMQRVAAWRMACAAADAAELFKAQARVNVIASIGDAYGLEGEWGHVLYTAGRELPRTAKAAAYDAIMKLIENRDSPLAEQVRAIAAMHTKTTFTGRQLRPWWADEKKKK